MGPPRTLVLPLLCIIAFSVFITIAFYNRDYTFVEYARQSLFWAICSLVIPLLEIAMLPPSRPLLCMNSPWHFVLVCIYLFPVCIFLILMECALIAVVIHWLFIGVGTSEFFDYVFLGLMDIPLAIGTMTSALFGASIHGIIVLLLPREPSIPKPKTDEQPQEVTNGYTSMGG